MGVHRFAPVATALARSLVILCAICCAPALAENGQARFEVPISNKVASGPLTGRLIVVVGTRESPEPRMTIGLTGPAMFGVDIEQLPPGQPAVVDATADAYPMESLSELPAGEYFVQAVLIRYGKVRRSDGHEIWVPTEHRRLNSMPFHALPGNLYSGLQKATLDPARGFSLRLELTEVIPQPEEPKDTEWLRHTSIKSRLLSEFWGRPMYLRATALVPRGYDEHPNVRYPAIYAQSQERTSPFYFDPDPASHERQLGLKDGNVQTGYEFYQTWKSDDFPRFVVIVIEQSSPYFLEAYSVDSANNGPYGRAIVEELIPRLEKKFRLIPHAYARLLEGASTGGWESLALQLKYPDFFGGAWIFNPDPIDFRHYGLVNIYRDENMFSVPLSKFTSVERPFRRTVEGQVTHTLRDLARLEAVMGSKGRSGYQLDAWQSVHGPVGPDGYPVLLFDKRTGVINREVAEYMRENGYDLTEYTRHNWPTLGPKLIGKLNFFSGEMDNFYLNLAVYDFQAMLAETRDPHYPGRFEYGRPKKGHNWHLTDFSEMIREMAEHVHRNAPPGEDTSQWRY
ncbi:MAG TPA: alpha/beta hydrolase-fold protein [Steroidobacter sp.]